MLRLHKIARTLSSYVPTQPKCTAAKINPKFINVRVTPKDYPDVLRLFWTAYATSEPAFVASGLSSKYNPVIDEMIMEDICQGHSIMSVCRETGEIVGASINYLSTEWDSDMLGKIADMCLCKELEELLRFYTYISTNPNLHEKYNQNKIFEVAYLMVQNKFRGQGIGWELLNSSRNYCGGLNVEMLRVICTSEISAKICNKMGLKLESEMPYATFKKSNGKQLYFPPKPHTSVKVYIDFPKTLKENC